MFRFVWILILGATLGCATNGPGGLPCIDIKEVSVDGVTLAYEDYGAGQPIVFIHGLGASSASWRQVAQELATSYRTICLNLMGFGRSEKPREEQYTLERQAYLVRRFLEELDLGAPVLVGQSYGGGVCLIVAYQLGEVQSETLGGLVLVDSICYPQELPGYVKKLRTPLVRTIGLWLVPPRLNALRLEKLFFYQDERINRALVRDYASSLRSKGARHALWSSAEHVVPANIDKLVESYPDISVPALIIWGKHDLVIPLNLGERLASEIPSARYVMLEDCGHNPQEELPSETAALIRSFLDASVGRPR